MLYIRSRSFNPDKKVPVLYTIHQDDVGKDKQKCCGPILTIINHKSGGSDGKHLLSITTVNEVIKLERSGYRDDLTGTEVKTQLNSKALASTQALGGKRF